MRGCCIHNISFSFLTNFFELELDCLWLLAKVREKTHFQRQYNDISPIFIFPKIKLWKLLHWFDKVKEKEKRLIKEDRYMQRDIPIQWIFLFSFPFFFSHKTLVTYNEYFNIKKNETSNRIKMALICILGHP